MLRGTSSQVCSQMHQSSVVTLLKLDKQKSNNPHPNKYVFLLLLAQEQAVNEVKVCLSVIYTSGFFFQMISLCLSIKSPFTIVNPKVKLKFVIKDDIRNLLHQQQ